MSENVVLKWLCLAAVFVVPFASYLLWHHFYGKKPDSKILRLLRPLIGVGCWLLTLVLMMSAQDFHEQEWFANHDFSAALTEDDLVELGDSSNVASGWLIFGWVPVFLMSWAVKFLCRDRAGSPRAPASA